MLIAKFQFSILERLYFFVINQSFQFGLLNDTLFSNWNWNF